MLKQLKHMINLVRNVKKKVSGMVWSLIFTGTMLLILGVLILVNDLIFRILIALFIFIVAYTFLFGAYRLWTIKKDFDKFFNK